MLEVDSNYLLLSVCPFCTSIGQWPCLFGLTTGRNDPPNEDFASPADTAGKRPAGGGWGIREAEPDEAGVVHRGISNLPDHTDEV